VEGHSVFCLLAFAFSWGWWGIRFAPLWGAGLGFGHPIDRAALGPLDVQIGMFGPLVAALVMRLGVSREGLNGVPGPVSPLESICRGLTAVGEEYGWRGYLLPRLLPGGEIRATLIGGVVWAVWHLPLLVSGLSFPGQPLSCTAR